MKEKLVIEATIEGGQKICLLTRGDHIKKKVVELMSLKSIMKFSNSQFTRFS